MLGSIAVYITRSCHRGCTVEYTNIPARQDLSSPSKASCEDRNARVNDFICLGSRQHFQECEIRIQKAIPVVPFFVQSNHKRLDETLIL